MTVLLWWKERLNAGEPLHNQETRPVGVDVRFSDRIGPYGWPNAVAKQALYDDYVWWHTTVYIKPFNDSPYYSDNPDKIPKPADRLAFFSAMQPLIAPTNLESSTYPVKVSVQHEGRIVKVKKSRAFYRLVDLEAHRVAFMTHTGLRLSDATPIYDAREIELLAKEQKRIK